MSKILPPAYEVRRKVIFILGNICLFTLVGAPHPADGGGGGGGVQPSFPMGGGYPFPGEDG